jgi:hypothetical protein
VSIAAYCPSRGTVPCFANASIKNRPQAETPVAAVSVNDQYQAKTEALQGRSHGQTEHYVGRGKDGEVKTSTKSFNAALMTEGLANLLVKKLNATGHHTEICELLADENSTIHDSLVSIGEAQAPVVVPTSLQELGRAIERCFREDHLSPLEVINFCNRVVLLG